MSLSVKCNILKSVFLGMVLIFSQSVLSCAETLKVSVAERWPPYSYLENGKYKGLDIDILELLLTKADLCWEYFSYPSSARAFKELKNSRIDLIFAASWNRERESFASFSLPYRSETMVLFSHVDQKKEFDFNSNSTVAVNRGSFYGNKFSDYRAQCDDCIVEVNLTHQRFALLQNKRVDFSIEDELTGIQALNFGNFYNITKRNNSVIHSNNVYYMLGLNEKGNMARGRINRAIKELDPDISRIINSYKQNLQGNKVEVTTPFIHAN